MSREHGRQGLPGDPSGMHLAHEIHIGRKPAAYTFAGPPCQMTQAGFPATLPASPEE